MPAVGLLSHEKSAVGKRLTFKRLMSVMVLGLAVVLTAREMPDDTATFD